LFHQLRTRAATSADAAAIAKIYNQGIEDRVATFETEIRSAEQIEAWFERDGIVIVVEADGEVGRRLPVL
jgi:phosphinothricin acetyltransferase